MDSLSQSSKSKILKEILLMTFGTLIMAVGIYFFKFPNNFSTGGVSGISVILGAISPNISTGGIMLIINVVLLILGAFLTGGGFCIRTVYCSLLLSLATYGFEFLCPMSGPFTDEPLLELVFAILLPAIGSALLFNLDASTGGTDIVAMIIKKHTSLNISKSLMVSDMLIVMAVFFVFGIKTWLFCVLGFFAKVFVVDGVVESLNISKYFTIITEKPEDIKTYITTELVRSATVSEDYSGAFTDRKKSVILTVVSRRQAILLRKKVKSIDPHAFVIITNTGDIIGKGFRESL